MNDIKIQILEYIRANKSVTFIELERLFNRLKFNYKGDLAYSNSVLENCKTHQIDM